MQNLKYCRHCGGKMVENKEDVAYDPKTGKEVYGIECQSRVAFRKDIKPYEDEILRLNKRVADLESKLRRREKPKFTTLFDSTFGHILHHDYYTAKELIYFK